MNVKMALLFDQAEQQAALPPKQRIISLEQVCKAAGVQVVKYEVGPYLEMMKDEIEISHPHDILTIISERKKTAAAGSNSSNVQNDATLDPTLPSAHSLLGTTKPAPSSAPSSSTLPENSSAIGK